MEVLKISLSDEEMAYVKQQPRGWVRTIIQRFIEAEHAALTPEELAYLRDHGGTKGVIARAKRERIPLQVDPETGEVQ